MPIVLLKKVTTKASQQRDSIISRFNVQTSHKTTFDAGNLVPIYVDEVLPGDTFSLSCTAFGRMATPIFPIMDNLHMDTFIRACFLFPGSVVLMLSCLSVNLTLRHSA